MGAIMGFGGGGPPRLNTLTTFCSKCKIALCVQCAKDTAKENSSKGIWDMCPNCKSEIPTTVLIYSD